MLGEISPYHDYYDSKSSSETPPSYNQLNFNENLQRFFKSKPKTTVSEESSSGVQGETDVEVKVGQETNQKCLSPVQNSGTSGSGSAGNLSSFSNPNTTVSNSDSYKSPLLTESLLVRHNEDMEKIMLKKHREHRSSVKDSKKSHHDVDKKNVLDRKIFDKNEQFLADYAHGIKRSGAPQSQNGDTHKISKRTTNQKVEPNVLNASSTTKPINIHNHLQTPTMQQPIYQSGLNDINLWPPFSVTVTNMNNTHTNTMTGAVGSPGGPGGCGTGMFPLYYIPTPQQRTIPSHFSDPVLNGSRYQVQYMPASMIYNYNNLYQPSPFICSTLPVLPLPMVPPTLNILNPAADVRLINPLQSMNGVTNVPVIPENKPNTPNTPHTAQQFQRPASQATSVKAEPGSIMGSIASASVANRALSECSRKDLWVQSVCSPNSPLVSMPDGEMEVFVPNKPTEPPEVNKQPLFKNSNINNIDESSSCYSSSYSSFLKTDGGSGSNDDSNVMDSKSNQTDENIWKSQKNCPIRKKDPPWLESVDVSPDLVYRYQVTVKNLEDILAADLNCLREFSQPGLVNDQLNQLYVDMETQGLSKKLTLEEGITSSSSSDENTINQLIKPKKKRKSYSYFAGDNL